LTFDEGVAIWTYLTAHCSAGGLTETAIELRAAELGDLSFDDAMVAARRWVRTQRWLPATADLREAILVGSLPNPGEAWGEVIRVVHRLGWTTPPTEADFSDPLILRAVQALGTWQDFCAGEESINRAHFLKIFPALAERTRCDLAAGPHSALPTGTTGVTLPDLRIDRDQP
jgi:hypothetical protein